MARKNYPSRSARRAARPELPLIAVGFLADTEGLWAIEMTNGSGRVAIEVYGTKATAWDWATEAGLRGAVKPGRWWPIGITSAANLVRGEGETFVLVA